MSIGENKIDEGHIQRAASLSSRMGSCHRYRRDDNPCCHLTTERETEQRVTGFCYRFIFSFTVCRTGGGLYAFSFWRGLQFHGLCHAIHVACSRLRQKPKSWFGRFSFNLMGSISVIIPICNVRIPPDIVTLFFLFLDSAFSSTPRRPRR